MSSLSAFVFFVFFVCVCLLLPSFAFALLSVMPALSEPLANDFSAHFECPAQDAAKSHLHCDLCLELLKNAITCSPCGHNYCQNCKKGYENQCKECRRAQNNYQYFANKTLDGIIAKVNFVQITLENI